MTDHFGYAYDFGKMACITEKRFFFVQRCGQKHVLLLDPGPSNKVPEKKTGDILKHLQILLKDWSVLRINRDKYSYLHGKAQLRSFYQITETQNNPSLQCFITCFISRRWNEPRKPLLESTNMSGWTNMPLLRFLSMVFHKSQMSVYGTPVFSCSGEPLCLYESGVNLLVHRFLNRPIKTTAKYNA